MTDKPPLARPYTISLMETDIAAIEELARDMYDGNRSMAVRAMIRHYMRYVYKASTDFLCFYAPAED